MTKEKKRGHIAATETENGSILWTTKLPETCGLDEKLQQKISKLLAGALEVSFPHFYD